MTKLSILDHPFRVYAAGHPHPALNGAHYCRDPHHPDDGYAVHLENGDRAGTITNTAAFLPDGSLLSNTVRPGVYVDCGDQAAALIAHQHLPEDGTDGHAARVIGLALGAAHEGEDVTFTLLDDRVTARSRYARAAITARGHAVGEVRFLCGHTGRTELWFYPLREDGVDAEDGEGVSVAEVRFTYRDGETHASTGRDFPHQQQGAWALHALADRHERFVQRALVYAARQRGLTDPPLNAPVQATREGVLFVDRSFRDARGYSLGVLKVESAALGEARVHWQPVVMDVLDLPEGWDPEGQDTTPGTP